MAVAHIWAHVVEGDVGFGSSVDVLAAIRPVWVTGAHANFDSHVLVEVASKAPASSSLG